MKLLDIPFNDRRRRYLVFHPNGLPDRLTLASTSTTKAFEAVGSSRFYVSEDQRMLAKVVPDKFLKRRSPIKWLLRDYLEKRWLLQSDARKEYQSLQILRRAGLQTPDCLGWGLSLNPGNRNASLLLMEHVQEARPGGAYFRSLKEEERLTFMERFCQQVLAVAKAGYVHRDLHFNNLLIMPDETTIWVDAHLKPLPHRPVSQWTAISSSLSASKLYGETYRKLAHSWLDRHWHDMGAVQLDAKAR